MSLIRLIWGQATQDLRWSAVGLSLPLTELSQPAEQVDGVTEPPRRDGRSPRKKSWFLESWDPGLLYLGYRRGPFYIRVAIETGVPTFSLRIVESRNLDQADGRIHKSAKVWVEFLEADFRRALGHASLAKRTLANQDYD